MDRSPYNARLLAWGRAVDGWWALVEWAQTIRRDGKLEQLAFAAWLPAASVTRPGWGGHGPSQVMRMTLPRASIDWPAPAAWQGWYAGAWRAGAVQLPEGAEIVTGPAWRKR